jgi:hypothetical protein
MNFVFYHVRWRLEHKVFIFLTLECPFYNKHFVTPRPTIFISAASKELKTSRQLVANTLQFLGYEPVWQDIFGTEQGDMREITACL